MPIKTTCNNCEKIIHRMPSHIKKKKHLFCSQKCVHEWQSKQIELSCDHCGNTLYRKTSKIKNGKHYFCCRKCHYAWRHKNRITTQKVKLTCENCKKLYEVDTFFNDPKNGRKSRYCSRACQHKSFSINRRGENNPLWKGGGDLYYGENWCQQRKKARKRDNFTCQSCNLRRKFPALHVHHIIPLREFNGNWKKANQLSNLITLCKSCHTLVTFNKITI